LYYVSKVTHLSCCNFDSYMNRFWYFFVAEMLCPQRKNAIKRHFIFSSHLTTAFAPSDTLNCIFSVQLCTLLCQHTKHIKTQLVRVEPSFITSRMAQHIRQYLHYSGAILRFFYPTGAKRCTAWVKFGMAVDSFTPNFTPSVQGWERSPQN